MNFYSTASFITGESFPRDDKGLYPKQEDAIRGAVKILKQEPNVIAVQVVDLDGTYCVTFNRHSNEFKTLNP